jgi:hypothetical protein
MKRGILLLAVAALSASADAGVHIAIRPDGSKLIYNDEVDSRRYRPVEMNDSWIVARISRPCNYDGIIERVAREQVLDPRLVKSVMLVESGFNPLAESRKGARGLMQLMPGTARAYGVRNSFNAEQNVRGAARYLTYLLNLYDGDLEQTLAAYNAGEGAVERYGGIPPYDETVLYVHKTLTAYYGRPYLGGGFGKAFTHRFRKLGPEGAPVHVERDADNRIVLTTGPAGTSRRR